jgi:hypothetical protein
MYDFVSPKLCCEAVAAGAKMQELKQRKRVALRPRIVPGRAQNLSFSMHCAFRKLDGTARNRERARESPNRSALWVYKRLSH